MSRYVWIKSKEDQVVRFEPRIPQKMFLDMMAENELEGIANMLQVLKSRQLGMSRLASLLILHRICFYPHVNAAMASSKPDKTRLLAEMLEFTLDRLPFWMVPNHNEPRA